MDCVLRIGRLGASDELITLGLELFELALHTDQPGLELLDDFILRGDLRCGRLGLVLVADLLAQRDLGERVKLVGFCGCARRTQGVSLLRGGESLGAPLLCSADVFGVVGLILRRVGIPAGPIVLGFLLGPLAEANLRRALVIGTPVEMLTRPISLVLLLLAAASLFWPIVKRSIDRRKAAKEVTPA